MFKITGINGVTTPIATPRGIAPWVQKIHAPTYWRAGRMGAGVRFGVIDSGSDFRHPYLGGHIIAGRSFIPGTSPDDWMDRHGHGSHVQGILRQGAPGAEYVIAKGLGDNGGGDLDRLAEAIDWCTDQGCHIINASWGTEEELPDDSPLRSAIQRAVDRGVLFGAAAGNEGYLADVSTVLWPARWPEPLVVAATWQMINGKLYSRRAPFSSAGPEIDITAPGSGIYSCAPGGGWVELSGTSMALPVALSAMALVREDFIAREGRDPTEPELVTLARYLTRDIPPAGRDALSGVGEIDLVPQVETRVITITQGRAQIRVQESNTLAEHTVTLDVPAELVVVDDEGGTRFFAEFRGLAGAAGAHEIDWNSDRALTDPVVGTATIDVLPGYEPREEAEE